jgi:short-subunit dehydrogenase
MTVREEAHRLLDAVPEDRLADAVDMAAHGSSAVLNVLSVLSWLSIPRSGAYCAAKSAEWSLTNALRLELAPQGTRVTALHVA